MTVTFHSYIPSPFKSNWFEVNQPGVYWVSAFTRGGRIDGWWLTQLLTASSHYLNLNCHGINRRTTPVARFMGQNGAHLGPTGPRWAPCCSMNFVIWECTGNAQDTPLWYEFDNSQFMNPTLAADPRDQWVHSQHDEVDIGLFIMLNDTELRSPPWDRLSYQSLSVVREGVTHLIFLLSFCTIGIQGSQPYTDLGHFC